MAGSGYTCGTKVERLVGTDYLNANGMIFIPVWSNIGNGITVILDLTHSL